MTDSNHVQNMITLEKTDSVISRTEQAFYLARIFCLIPVFFLEKSRKYLSTFEKQNFVTSSAKMFNQLKSLIV